MRAALLLLSACAGGSRAAPMAPLAESSDPHAQIDRLAQDIVARGGAFEPQASAAVPDLHPAAVFPRSTDDSCHPAKTDTCTDACKVSDAICDDAKQICDIAGNLPGDAWAAGKCDSGKQSCTDANAKCCRCS